MSKALARYVCLILLALGAGASLVAVAARGRVESANRTVAVILDYDQVRELSAVAGVPLRQLLVGLREAGATHVAVTEQTLRLALQSGDVVGVPPSGPKVVAGLPSTGSFAGAPETIQRLHRSLVERLGQRSATLVAAPSGAYRVDLHFVAPTDVLELGIGYPQAAVQGIHEAGLAFVPRPFADGNQWQAATDAALELAKERNAKLVIFAGTAAPGYPANLAHVADGFGQAGLLFGYIEFGKQYGDMGLAARLPQNLIRVHSINETEMLGLTPQRAVDRFVLAVRERNIRACYVRLFEPCGADPGKAAEGYLRALTDRLKSHGFALGAPEPYPDLGLAPLLRWLAMLGPLGALGLCLIELLGCRPLPTIVLIAAGAALALVGAFVALTPTAKLCALLGALALPTLAVGRRLPEVAPVSALGARLGRSLLLFAASSGVGLVAGLFIVGCLADTRFMVKLDQFSGVKLAHLLPLVAVLLLQIGWDMGGRGAREGESPLTTLVRGWQRGVGGAVKYWHAVLLLVCLAALALLILRSGNESGVGVSALELRFRAVLDHVFGVRPRTKEVLIGHPLLVLAFARAMAGKRRGLWALLGLGAVGQVSLVNTFSHLHTPLLVSLIRTLHGLWFGALMGLALYLAVELAERLWHAAWPRVAPEPSDAA